jgi:hypothetical protein
MIKGYKLQIFMDVLDVLSESNFTFYKTGSQLREPDDPLLVRPRGNDFDYMAPWSAQIEEWLMLQGFKDLGSSASSSYGFDFGTQGVVKILRYIPGEFKKAKVSYSWIDVQLLEPWALEYKRKLHQLFGYIERHKFPTLFSLVKSEDALLAGLTRLLVDYGYESKAVMQMLSTIESFAKSAPNQYDQKRTAVDPSPSDKPLSPFHDELNRLL